MWPKWIKALVGPRASASGWVNRSPLDDYWYEPRTDNPERITELTALQYATVYACVQKISKTVATLPLQLYRRTRDGKEDASEHPLYGLLHDQPNSQTTAVSCWESVMANLLLWGTAYLEIQRTNNGRSVVALYPLLSAEVRPVLDERGRLLYEHRPDGAMTPDRLPEEKVLRIAGLSLGGLVGLAPVAYGRLSISLGLSAARHGDAFFRNGAIPGTVLQRPKESSPLSSDEVRRRIVESFNQIHSGTRNAYRTALLEEGMEAKTLTLPMKDAQFLESRQFQRTEICGLFDCPPHKIADLERATFSNVEQQNIQWVTDCIGPWCVRLQAALNASLPFGSDAFCEFNLAGLLRGDIQGRYAAYATARQWGWMSVNEIRRLENLNAIEGGDSYLVPANMIDATQVGATETAPVAAAAAPRTEAADGARRAAQVAAMHAVAASIYDRLADRAAKAVAVGVKRAMPEGRDACLAFLDGWMRREEAITADMLRPLGLAAALLQALSEPDFAAAAEADRAADAWQQAAYLKVRDLLAEPESCLERLPHAIAALGQKIAEEHANALIDQEPNPCG